MKAQALVARNLRRLRVARGLSQENLAVDAGIDRTYVSRLERGLENPTVAVLEQLAVALGAGTATQSLPSPGFDGLFDRRGIGLSLFLVISELTQKLPHWGEQLGHPRQSLL